jgi:membrane dipeptidase
MPGPHAVRPEVLEFHRSIPVVDLVVGTVLFRRGLLASRSIGHVDLPRLVAAGVDLVGLTLATRFPNLRGTLSGPHFRSLGISADGNANMPLASAFIERMGAWAADSDGRLELVGSGRDIRAIQAANSGSGSRVVRAFVGVQGGHVLDGDPANVERLAARGVRMLALAHVMDNELVGSSTGVAAGGLTGLGRAVVAELERASVVVDLAHMSSAGIADTVPLLRKPFIVSHTGFRDRAGGRSRWRRYGAASRNLSREDVRAIADAGGVIGVTLSTQLLGGRDLGSVLDGFAYAADVAGPEHVALGSDFDGALETVFDVTGLPLVTQGLLERGFSRQDVAAVMGGNALRVMSGAWPP